MSSVLIVVLDNSHFLKQIKGLIQIIKSKVSTKQEIAKAISKE